MSIVGVMDVMGNLNKQSKPVVSLGQSISTKALYKSICLSRAANFEAKSDHPLYS